MTNIRKNEIDFDDRAWRIAFDSANNPIIENETTGVIFTFNDDGSLNTEPIDVRNVSSPEEGQRGYHDGSGTNTEGPAFYNGSSWISTVDGSTIS